MAWLAVDDDKEQGEYIYPEEPSRTRNKWTNGGSWIYLPKGSIEKLIGRKLTWDDEPVEI